MVACLICNEPMKEDGSRNYRRTTYWFWCEECEFGQVDPMPTSKEIADYYASGEYRRETHKHIRPELEFEEEPQDFNINEEEARGKGWLDYIDPPEKHLDVGASTGKVLEVIDAPCQSGVEPGPWSRFYRSYPNMDIKVNFDLVTSFHTLEHVTDPVDFLRSIKRLATDQVCIEVPQPVMRQWPHLSDFRNKSLLRAMEYAGMPAKIVEDEYHIKAKHVNGG